MGISRLKLFRMSQLGIKGKATSLLVGICKKVGGHVYISGASGRRYIEEGLFNREGIVLKYSDFIHPQYKQLWGDFIPNLSILDLIFNEGSNSLNIILSTQPQ